MKRTRRKPQPPETILSFRRPGAWAYQGSYRRRVVDAVREISRAYDEFDEAVKIHPEKGSNVRIMLPPEFSRRVEDHSNDALLYACISIEAFLNYYGVVRLGEEYFTRHFESIPTLRKLRGVIEVCCGTQLSNEDEILTLARNLLDRRNKIVHPKTREADSKRVADLLSRPALVGSKADLADMDRILELFCQYDPTARGSGF